MQPHPHPKDKEPGPGREKCQLEPLLAQEDWDYALTERIGIIGDGENLSSAESALAYSDTINNHGPRP